MHPDTVYARDRCAHSHRRIGRRQEEVSLIEQLAADHERLLGPRHPRTLHVQAGLASLYYEGNYDTAAAVALGERIIADVAAVIGPDQLDLRDLRAMLMLAYWQDGRADDAYALVARYPQPDDPEPG